MWGQRPDGSKDSVVQNGAVLIGSEGWVIANYREVFAHPASLLTSPISPSDKRILSSSAFDKFLTGLPKGFHQILTAGHHQHWIRAIRNSGPSVDDIAMCKRPTRCFCAVRMTESRTDSIFQSAGTTS